MASIQLTKEIIDHFKISACKHTSTPSGQKNVFIVEIEGQQYALKIIHIADERFEREVKISQQFNHLDGIPSIIKVEQFRGETIVLEEYIEGFDLSEIAAGYIGQANAVKDLIYKTASILEPVWLENYVHRDLKPQNIRVRPDGSVVVLDFGIARALGEESITATGTQPLSWFYASPEQYAGKKNLISYRTDLFCLGIIAFYLFTGRLPFGATKDEIAKKFLSPPYTVDSGSLDIDLLCNAVFKHTPSERPRKISKFLDLVKP
jgi:serine/threonine-protein kinase